MNHGKQLDKYHASRNNYMDMDLEDVIRLHALPFLPAKSLLRFQGVCRDWKRQISSPFFAHNQSFFHRSVSGLFYQSCGAPPLLISKDPNSCGVPDPSLSFLPEPVDVRSSSNGLLCCQSRTGDRAYYVCNPVTKQWKKLPRPTADHGFKPAIVLVFEPSLLNFSAEFKLVCAIPSSDFDDAVEFELYSSVDDSWKVSGDICFLSHSISPTSGVHVGNVVYWKLQYGGILSLDLARERSQLLQNYDHYAGILGNMKGKLCLASLNRHHVVVSVLSNIHYNTMEMTTYTKMFEDKYNILLKTEVLVRGDRVEIVLVADDLLVVRSGAKIYSIDMKTEETKLLREYIPAPGDQWVPYVNSLVSSQ